LGCPTRGHVGAAGINRFILHCWINRVIGDESISTDLAYQAPGPNKFTDAKILQLPAWLFDRSKIAERQRFSFTT